MVRRLLIVFIILGLVSLFADMTYEGARSILGAYLEVLEAGIIVAGFVSIGDLVSYGMRGVGGLLAGRFRSSRVYWALVFAGYAINLFAVPLLAYAGKWELAVALILIERAGKGLRAPARDVILSEVTEGIGRGKGFGLHEVMDQAGAVIGPSFVAWNLMVTGGDYRATFILLLIPAFISLLLLSTAAILYPRVKAALTPKPKGGVLPRSFWIYSSAMALLSMGFIHWYLVSYYIKGLNVFPDHYIATLYIIAMASDAIVALPAGIIYDRIKFRSLVIAPFLAPAIIVLLFTSYNMNLIPMAIVWGILMGLYETIMRASVADLVPAEARAYAYGVYGVIYGFSWTIGNIVIALLLRYNLYNILYIYVVLVEAIALALIIQLISLYRAHSSSL